MKQSNRDSNIELARIVAMISIIIFHFVRHGIFMNRWPAQNGIDYTREESWILFLTMFVMFGTDLFAIISGFFGINLRWKSILTLWSLCSFYNVIRICIENEFSISSFTHCFIIFSTPQWYFTAYLWLLLFSPLLNSGIKHFNRQQLKIFIFFGFFLCGISGWYFESENVWGCNLYQLIYMYLLGQYIRREEVVVNAVPRYLFLCVYLIFCFLGYIFGILYVNRGLCISYYHNSPFVMISAVAMFCFLRSFNFQNKIINYVASYMPALLLFSDVSIKKILYYFVAETCRTYNYSLHSFCMFGVAVVVLLVMTFIIDSIRRMMFDCICNSLASKLENIIPFKVFDKNAS